MFPTPLYLRHGGISSLLPPTPLQRVWISPILVTELKTLRARSRTLGDRRRGEKAKPVGGIKPRPLQCPSTPPPEAAVQRADLQPLIHPSSNTGRLEFNPATKHGITRSRSPPTGPSRAERGLQVNAGAGRYGDWVAFRRDWSVQIRTSGFFSGRCKWKRRSCVYLRCSVWADLRLPVRSSAITFERRETGSQPSSETGAHLSSGGQRKVTQRLGFRPENQPRLGIKPE